MKILAASIFALMLLALLSSQAALAYPDAQGEDPEDYRDQQEEGGNEFEYFAPDIESFDLRCKSKRSLVINCHLLYYMAHMHVAISRKVQMLM